MSWIVTIYDLFIRTTQIYYEPSISRLYSGWPLLEGSGYWILGMLPVMVDTYSDFVFYSLFVSLVFVRPFFSSLFLHIFIVLPHHLFLIHSYSVCQTKFKHFPKTQPIHTKWCKRANVYYYRYTFTILCEHYVLHRLIRHDEWHERLEVKWKEAHLLQMPTNTVAKDFDMHQVDKKDF